MINLNYIKSYYSDEPQEKIIGLPDNDGSLFYIEMMKNCMILDYYKFIKTK